MNQWWRIGGRVVVAMALAFGAREAVQAAPLLREPNCPENGNWCAASRGGEQNCLECCGPRQGSFCWTDEEDVTEPYVQGCICA
jgi:hypothetical protein